MHESTTEHRYPAQLHRAKAPQPTLRSDEPTEPDPARLMTAYTRVRTALRELDTATAALREALK